MYGNGLCIASDMILFYVCMYVRWRLDAGCVVLKHQHGECVKDSGLDRLDFKSLESDPVDYLVVG